MHIGQWVLVRPGFVVRHHVGAAEQIHLHGYVRM